MILRTVQTFMTSRMTTKHFFRLAEVMPKLFNRSATQCRIDSLDKAKNSKIIKRKQDFYIEVFWNL